MSMKHQFSVKSSTLRHSVCALRHIVTLVCFGIFVANIRVNADDEEAQKTKRLTNKKIIGGQNYDANNENKQLDSRSVQRSF